MALYGIDISYWQRNNYKKLIDEEGKDFVIARAAFNKDVDAYCDKIYQYAKKQGKLLGFYFFPLNKNYSAVDHARWAYEQVKGYIGEAIPMLDWEAYRENGVDYVNVGDIAWAKAWLDEFYRLSGVRPVVYASASVINGYDWSSVAKDYGLWIAGYPNKYNVDYPPTPSTSDMPYGIGAWAFWAIWQYSSSNGKLDRDIANMDATAWRKYAAVNGEAKPTPQPTPQPQPAKKTNEQMADEVIAGEWGNDEERKQSLTAAGYNYDAIQAIVNQKLGANTIYYSVRRGDTLSGIATRYGTTWQKIYADNKDKIKDPDVIYPSQVLVIK